MIVYIELNHERSVSQVRNTFCQIENVEVVQEFYQFIVNIFF